MVKKNLKVLGILMVISIVITVLATGIYYIVSVEDSKPLEQTEKEFQAKVKSLENKNRKENTALAIEKAKEVGFYDAILPIVEENKKKIPEYKRYIEAHLSEPVSAYCDRKYFDINYRKRSIRAKTVEELCYDWYVMTYGQFKNNLPTSVKIKGFGTSKYDKYDTRFYNIEDINFRRREHFKDGLINTAKYTGIMSILLLLLGWYIYTIKNKIKGDKRKKKIILIITSSYIISIGAMFLLGELYLNNKEKRLLHEAEGNFETTWYKYIQQKIRKSNIQSIGGQADKFIEEKHPIIGVLNKPNANDLFHENDFVYFKAKYYYNGYILHKEDDGNRDVERYNLVSYNYNNVVGWDMIYMNKVYIYEGDGTGKFKTSVGYYACVMSPSSIEIKKNNYVDINIKQAILSSYDFFVDSLPYFYPQINNIVDELETSSSNEYFKLQRVPKIGCEIVGIDTYARLTNFYNVYLKLGTEPYTYLIKMRNDYGESPKQLDRIKIWKRWGISLTVITIISIYLIAFRYKKD